MKILVVDDAKMARKILVKNIPEAVKEHGEVLQASNGQEGLDLYKEHKPDLMFLDLTMPIMDGFECLEKIMEFDNNANVYVVTADIQQAAQDKVKELGGKDVLQKPADPEKIKNIVLEYLKNE
ncbi:MAG: response regulator [Campylobacterales bacterium]|nr:response regulator [Campylobacterales bacterium]